MSTQPIIPQPSDAAANAKEIVNTLAKKRPAIPIAFAIIIVLFFFGFCDFKCNSVKVASLTGINMVTGTHLKSAAGPDISSAFDPFGDRSVSENREDKVGPNVWAILALLSAIGGAYAFYKKIKNESLAGTAAGTIGFISLLLLRSAIKSKVTEQTGGMVQIEIDFLFAYWASLLAFAAAGGLSYLRLKHEKTLPTQTAPAGRPVTPLNVKIITSENAGAKD